MRASIIPSRTSFPIMPNSAANCIVAHGSDCFKKESGRRPEHRCAHFFGEEEFPLSLCPVFFWTQFFLSENRSGCHLFRQYGQDWKTRSHETKILQNERKLLDQSRDSPPRRSARQIVVFSWNFNCTKERENAQPTNFPHVAIIAVFSAVQCSPGKKLRHNGRKLHNLNSVPVLKSFGFILKIVE